MRNKTILIIIGLFVLAISLRSLNLNRGFFGDEAITLLSASANFPDIISLLIKHDAHPPLTAILLHFWMGISRNEIFIRYYFILFGIGVLLIIYLIARKYLNKNRQFALLVLFLGTISPMLISMSQFIRNYIDSAFWMLLSNYFLLLIVKNKGTKWIWVGYSLSALLSIYTFYYSAFMILSQSIYMVIFKFKERAIMKKWILSQMSIALLFLPWVPYCFRQIFNKGSSMSLHWERFGFKFAGLDLGIYARNISALFGFDHFFMVYPEGIVNHFRLPVLCFMTILVFFSLLVFLSYTLKMLKETFTNDIENIWFSPCLSLLPMVISWGVAKVTKTTPTNVRYLVAPHAMFLILLSCFFYSFISRYKKSGVVFLCAFSLLYLLRIPAAITPMYDGNKALQYLDEHVRSGDCIVMAERMPGRKNLPIPSFNIENYLYEMNPKTSEYRPLPESSAENIKNALRPFKRIWFIRWYGNTEIFGGNKLVYDFLKHCGRKETAREEFHNIKLILME